MKFERHKWHIEQHRTELIEDIMNVIVHKKAEQLELKSGIIFNAIDDQSNEVISSVKNDGTVVLDCNGFERNLKLSELSTDILISLLETIEKDKVSVSVEMNPEDYFWGKYKPEYNHVLLGKLYTKEDTGGVLPEDMCSFGGCMYETYGEELAYVSVVNRLNPNRVWTIVENNDGNPMVICAGMLLVNRMGYLITEVGWTNKDEEYVFE